MKKPSCRDNVIFKPQFFISWLWGSFKTLEVFFKLSDGSGPPVILLRPTQLTSKSSTPVDCFLIPLPGGRCSRPLPPPADSLPAAHTPLGHLPCAGSHPPPCRPTLICTPARCWHSWAPCLGPSRPLSPLNDLFL